MDCLPTPPPPPPPPPPRKHTHEYTVTVRSWMSRHGQVYLNLPASNNLKRYYSCHDYLPPCCSFTTSVGGCKWWASVVVCTSRSHPIPSQCSTSSRRPDVYWGKECLVTSNMFRGIKRDIIACCSCCCLFLGALLYEVTSYFLQSYNSN